MKTSEVRCCIDGCNASLQKGDSFYRANRFGVKGIWVCKAHRPQTDAPRDMELDAFMTLLEDAKQKVPDFD